MPRPDFGVLRADPLAEGVVGRNDDAVSAVDVLAALGFASVDGVVLVARQERAHDADEGWVFEQARLDRGEDGAAAKAVLDAGIDQELADEPGVPPLLMLNVGSHRAITPVRSVMGCLVRSLGGLAIHSSTDVPSMRTSVPMPRRYWGKSFLRTATTPWTALEGTSSAGALTRG